MSYYKTFSIVKDRVIIDIIRYYYTLRYYWYRDIHTIGTVLIVLLLIVVLS